jgi:biuret amidohydrolase
MEVGIEPTVRHGADLGLIRVVVIDACGAGDPVAAQRSLDSLAVAGDAILTDVTTIIGLLARPTTGEPGPKGAAPGLAAEQGRG